MANNTLIVLLAILLTGCVGSGTKTTTDPLKPFVIQEVSVPVPACPKQVDDVVIPTRPILAIDNLSPADREDYTKIGQAYQRTITDLQEYAVELETAAFGIRDICKSVNTLPTGKKQ